VSIFPDWLLVAGVAGGWWLVTGGWWLVAGGWWLDASARPDPPNKATIFWGPQTKFIHGALRKK
jgi:hypothetical protein